MSERTIRVALAIDHPAQQFTKALQLLVADSGLDVHVYYWSTAQRYFDPGFDREISWDVNLFDGYSWSEPSSPASLTGKLFWFWKQWHKLRPKVIVCYGWASPIASAAILYALLRHDPKI